MKTTYTTAVLLSFALAITPYSIPVYAAPTKSITIDCTRAKIQPAIDAASPSIQTIIKIKGKCVENLDISPQKFVVLSGSTGASLKPKITTQPAISSWGAYTVIKNLMISNSNGAAFSLVQSNDGGHLAIIGSILSAPYVDEVVGIYKSTGFIANSRISGGTADTVEAQDGSSLQLVADPGYTGGLNASKMEVIATRSSNALTCGIGSSIDIKSLRADSSEGQFTLTNAGNGLLLESCSVQTTNKTSNVTNLSITDNLNGIRMKRGNLFLRKTYVGNNQYVGMIMNQSNAQIGSSTFQSNSVDINAQLRSNVVTETYWGVNQFPDSVVSPYESFACSTGGHIDIETGSLNQDITGLYDDDCVTLY